LFIVEAYILYYVLATVGITFGYHRHFAHGLYKVHPIIECVVLYCGLICGWQSALSWSGVHRLHHKYADTKKDPHSPLYHKWYEIIFSTWRIQKIPRSCIKDLYTNPRVVFFHRHRYSILILTYVILFPFTLYLLSTFVLSYMSFGMLNLFGHNKKGPINSLWINFFAPFEGMHHDHHKKRPIYEESKKTIHS
jgi:stearoyl-CoA desaturase (delta-9 desaturase)